MQQGKYVTSGIVLRETETRESDKILTVLTGDLGKISVIARGARRKGSRIAAVCQLLAYSEMTLYQRGEWYYLDEGSTIMLFEALRQDFEKLSLAAYFAELTEFLSEGATAPEMLPLLLNALYALSALDKEPLLVKTAFELRLMALSGFEPLCDGCAVCGRGEVERPMLDVVQGILHCAACRQKGGLSLPLSEGGVAALRYILHCEAKKLYSFRVEKRALQGLSHAAEGFMAAQLERSFRTLDYYKTIHPSQEDT